MAAVAHSNGVTWRLSIDPADGLQRPHRITTSLGADTGLYDYDGAGNVKAIDRRLPAQAPHETNELLPGLVSEMLCR